MATLLARVERYPHSIAAYPRLWPKKFTGIWIVQAALQDEEAKQKGDGTARNTITSSAPSLETLLYAYVIHFKPIDCLSDPPQAAAEDFVLLVAECLDNDVVSGDMELFLPHSSVAARLHPLGPFSFNHVQLEEAKISHVETLRIALGLSENGFARAVPEPLRENVAKSFNSKSNMEWANFWCYHRAYILLNLNKFARLTHRPEMEEQLTSSLKLKHEIVKYFWQKDATSNAERHADFCRSLSVCHTDFFPSKTTNGTAQDLEIENVVKQFDNHQEFQMEEAKKMMSSSDVFNTAECCSSRDVSCCEEKLQSTSMQDPPEILATNFKKHLILRNGTFRIADVIDSLVTGVQNHEPCIVLTVSSDLTAESPVPGKGKLGSISYAEYFKSKHGLEIKHTQQPLLLLRRLKASNMLIQKPRAVQTESNRHSKIYMPPELCVLSDRFTGQTVRGAVRLPSVMHRLHCLLLASELKAHFGLSGVSPRKLLEALTARGSQEGYSYERHEFLGDAYLRYAVARSLFFNHFDASELRLAELLTNQVSNKELKKLAVEAGLPYYIVSEHFDVRAWEAPGLSAIPMREDKPIREQANVCPDRQCCDVRNEGFDLLSCHSSFCRSEQAISDKIIADVVEAIIGLLILERDDEDYAVKFMTSIGIEAGYVVQSLRLNPGELPVGDTCVLGIHEGNRSDLGAGATMKNSPWLTTDIKPKSPKDSLEDLKRPLIANPPASLNECSMAAPPQGFRELGASFLKLKERNNNMASEIGDEEMNKVESLIGYTFRRRYLLSKVLRHASCEEESVDGSYFEKLAHLGNAAIDYVLTWQLLINNPDRDPGTLNILRQAAVNNERYARMIIRCGLQKHFRVAHGGLKQRIAAFVRAVEEEESGRESEGADFPKHAFGHVTASAPKALSDLCGALAGAIILDCDFDANTLWQVYKPLASPLPEAGRTAIHPTAELVLLCQKNAWSIEARTNDCSDCGDHIVELWINGRVAAWAENSSYQTARRLASNEALKNLSEEGKPKDEVVDFCCKSAVNKQFTETDLPSREGEEGKLDRNRNVLQGGALGSQLFEDSCRVSREMFHDELPSKERAYDEGRDGKSKWWSQSRVLFGKPETRNAIFVCSETSINKHPAQKTEESKAPLLPGEDLIEEEDTEPAARTGQDSGVSWKEWEHTRGISHENVSTDIGSSLVNNATVRADNGDKAPSEGSDTGKFSDDCSYVLKTKGLSRQILVHLCTKNGWKLPTYKLLKEEGTQHCPLFVFCSHVAIQDEEISAAGTPMPSHAKAKDSAALSMLLKLEKLGLSWTCK